MSAAKLNSPHDKLAAARLRACTLAPYFRSGVLSLIPREAPGLGTLAVTDKWIMLWDPAFVAATPDHELAAVVIHEMLHVTLNHAARCKAMGAEHRRWNIAADAAINDAIGALPLPKDVVTPATLGLPSGWTAEAYYRALDQRAKEKQEQQQSQPSGEGQGEGNDPSSQPSDRSTGDKPGQGRACGSCSGHAHEKEAQHTQGENGRTPAEIVRAQKQIAADVQSEARKGRGNVPGELARWAEATLAPPKIDWRTKLAQLVRASAAHAAGAVTHKYCRPSRRQAGLGYGAGVPTLPALVAPKPRVAVALDTSGSMGGQMLTDALTEIRGILTAIGAPIDFVACDAATGKLVQAHTISEARKAIVGGGGTDFRPVFAAFDKRKPCVDVLVYLTDGYGPAPETPPRYRVIWALIGGKNPPCKWGQSVVIE